MEGMLGFGDLLDLALDAASGLLPGRAAAVATLTVSLVCRTLVVTIT